MSKGGRGEGQESTRPQAVAPVRTHPSHNQILFQILVSSHSPDQGSQTQDHHEINERNESSVRQQGMVGTVAKWKKYVSSEAYKVKIGKYMSGLAWRSSG